MVKKIIVVGAGQAGFQTVLSLRQADYHGSIILFSGEKQYPYMRPPLSKEYLLGTRSEDSLFFRHKGFYDSHSIAFKANYVKAINRRERNIVDDQGVVYSYDILVLAIGSENRKLNNQQQSNDLLYLRTLAEANQLKDHIDMANRGKYLVIGGGFIGLEVASSLNKLNQSVTVLEASQRLMSRILPDFFSEWYLKLHQHMGIQVHLLAKLLEIERDSQQYRVCFEYEDVKDGGNNILRENFDHVIVGIGSVVNVNLAQNAGIDCDVNGIIVNQNMQTSDRFVYAVGDCTSHINPYSYDSKRIRLESVQNAIDQSKIAVSNILANPKPYQVCPWFWTVQYQITLQMAGLFAGYDRVYWRGDSVSNSLLTGKIKSSCFYFNKDRLLAVHSINAPGDHLICRELLQRELSPKKDQIKDLQFPLKNLLS